MHEIEMGAGRTPFHSTSFSVLSTQKYLLPTLLSLFSVLGGGESCASTADCHPHAQAGIRSIVVRLLPPTAEFLSFSHSVLETSQALGSWELLLGVSE